MLGLVLGKPTSIALKRNLVLVGQASAIGHTVCDSGGCKCEADKGSLTQLETESCRGAGPMALRCQETCEAGELEEEGEMQAPYQADAALSVFSV